MIVICRSKAGKISGTVHKIEVMHDGKLGNAASQGEVSVGGKEQVGPVLFQDPRDAEFKPEEPQQGMAGRGRNYYRRNIAGKDKFFGIRPVEKEYEPVSGVVTGDPFQGFTSEPADPFKPFLQKQPCVDDNDHRAKKFNSMLKVQSMPKISNFSVRIINF